MSATLRIYRLSEREVNQGHACEECQAFAEYIVSRVSLEWTESFIPPILMCEACLDRLRMSEAL